MSPEDLFSLIHRLKKEVKKLNFQLNKLDLEICSKDNRIAKLMRQLQQTGDNTNININNNNNTNKQLDEST